MKIAFDVDGTLIQKSSKGRDTPRYTVLNMMFHFKIYHEIYVWSGGGRDYARDWCEKLGIDEMVTVIDKNITASAHYNIDLTVDDEDISLAKTNIKV